MGQNEKFLSRKTEREKQFKRIISSLMIYEWVEVGKKQYLPYYGRGNPLNLTRDYRKIILVLVFL
jgi:hypothetical protein